MAAKSIKKYALVNPIMPFYRYGVYNELSISKDVQVDFFTDIKEINGIKNISFNLSEVPVEKGGLRWCKINSYSYTVGKILFVIWYSNLLKVVTRKDYDGIIFVESPHSPAHWIFPIIARLWNKHVIFWGHGYYGNENRLKSILRLTSIRIANDFLLYGQHALSLLVVKGIKKKKLHVVYNSLDFKSQIKYREVTTKEIAGQRKRELFNRNDLPVLLFIGRLEPGKRVLMLLQAIVELRKVGVETNVLIIGDGPEKIPMQEFIEVNHLENICFYGKCYEEKDLATLISLSDVSVSPGNVGLNCIHSLMYGTPIITHDNTTFQNPEVEAILPGFNGDLYEFGSQEDLISKIKDWIYKKREDPATVSNCYKVVDEVYNPINQTELIVDVIKRHWSSEGQQELQTL